MATNKGFTLDFLYGLIRDDLGRLYDEELFKDNLLNFMLDRSYNKGIDDAGYDFEDYSPSYIKKRAAAGIFPPDKVNLSFSGEMLNSIRVIRDESSGHIGSKINGRELGVYRVVSDGKPRGRGVSNADIVNFINDGTRNRRGLKKDAGGKPLKRSKRMEARRFLYIDDLDLNSIIEDTLNGIRYPDVYIPKRNI